MEIKWIVEGPIEEDVFNFKRELMRKLEADGWQIKIDARDHYRCKPTKEWYKANDATRTNAS